ncbi:hypothetical protein ElyMa_002150900 [Elysia marginata]|uniref:Uncharacterized protein n=1 Tax=Elysia marginata TaxID=1093978 RepID=A0AAV4FNX4_9GAST|nr:hypothetical protein ElyMa_002150900 [Elysia marginata]
MSSLLLKLTVLAIILAVVASTQVERERRAFKFSRFFKRVGGGIKKAAVTVGKGIKKAAVAVKNGIRKLASTKAGRIFTRVAVPWMFPWSALRHYAVAATVEEEAEIILVKTESSINKGKELVQEGAKLLAKADDLEKSVGNEVHKRGLDDSIVKGFNAVIQAIRKAAERVIKAGKKVISNSDRIKAAFEDAAVDISHVVSDGVADVGSAIADIGESISEAGKTLEQAKTSADNVSEDFGDAISELTNAGAKAIEAGEDFEEVGRRSVNLFKRILKVGKNIVKVFAKAASNIFQAAALSVSGKK